MLYCPKCQVIAYRKHRCHPSTLVPIKRELRGVVDQFARLDIGVMSASWFTNPVAESLYDHHITFNLEIRHELPPVLALPDNWNYYTEIIGTDFQISAIGYSEIYTWDTLKSPQERAQQIADNFSMYLSTLDKFSIEALRTLYNTGGGVHVK